MAVVVVDKCYLQGASRAEVANLLVQNHAIMPAALLHEVLRGHKSELGGFPCCPHETTRCFPWKIPVL